MPRTREFTNLISIFNFHYKLIIYATVDPQVIHLEFHLSPVHFYSHFLATPRQNPQLGAETNKHTLDSHQSNSHHKVATTLHR